MPAKKTAAASVTATATAKRPSARRRRSVTEEMVRERAYYLSMTGSGSPVDHWLAAERELLVGA
jgi:hypothetical protein